jgi:hypothetical protein
MAPSTARSRSWRPCTSEQTPILTEHHSDLLHSRIGLFRLTAVGHPRGPTCSLIARDDYAWRSLPSATERRLWARRDEPASPRTRSHIGMGHDPEVPVGASTSFTELSPPLSQPPAKGGSESRGVLHRWRSSPTPRSRRAGGRRQLDDERLHGTRDGSLRSGRIRLGRPMALVTDAAACCWLADWRASSVAAVRGEVAQRSDRGRTGGRCHRRRRGSRCRA